MPPKSSSSAAKKPNTRARPKRQPSPIVLSESENEGDDVGSDVQSGEGTPEPPENVPETGSQDVESDHPSDVEIDVVQVKKKITHKRSAPEDDSASDVEIVPHSHSKKMKVSVEPPSLRTTLVSKLDQLPNVGKHPKSSEKPKAIDTKGKSPVKKTASSTKKKPILAEKDVSDEAPTTTSKKVSKIRRVNTPKPTEHERGELPKCLLLPFSSNASASGDERMMDIDSLKDSMLSKGDRLLLEAALRFKSVSPFLNPSLASPDQVVIERDHLVWPDSHANAVFFTTDCVSACNLIVPTTSGGANGAGVKKLLLFPIENVFQAGIDFFGFKFKANQVAGQINNTVVAYATKKEGQKMYPSGSSSMGSPKKSALFSRPSSKSVAPIGGTFPIGLSFDDKVPIYDATEGGFEFSRTDLENVRALPLYQKGKKDLPPYAVVTVAYTVTYFPTSNSPSCDSGFLFNILFVLLLAQSLKDTDTDD